MACKKECSQHLYRWALCEPWFCQPNEGSAIFLAAGDVSSKITLLLPESSGVLVTSGL